jgi:hypothetical protein
VTRRAGTPSSKRRRPLLFVVRPTLTTSRPADAATRLAIRSSPSQASSDELPRTRKTKSDWQKPLTPAEIRTRTPATRNESSYGPLGSRERRTQKGRTGDRRQKENGLVEKPETKTGDLPEREADREKAPGKCSARLDPVPILQLLPPRPSNPGTTGFAARFIKSKQFAPAVRKYSTLHDK